MSEETSLFKVDYIDEEQGLVYYVHKNYRELQAECKQKGLPATGNTEQLCKRITRYNRFCRKRRNEELRRKYRRRRWPLR